MLSFRDITADHIMRLAEKIRRLRGTVPRPAAIQ